MCHCTQRSISNQLGTHMRHAITIVYKLVNDGRVLLINCGSLIGTTVVTSAFGFAYWWVAARLFPPQAVGVAAAAVSAMMLVATISEVGLPTLLVGELPLRRGSEWPLIITALIPPGIIGGLLGAIVGLFAPRISAGLAPLAGNLASIGIFALGTSFMAVTTVLDEAFLGLLHAELQLVRNSLMAGAKFGAILLIGFWFRSSMGIGIYLSWVIGMVLSLVGLVGIKLLRRQRIHLCLPHGRLMQGLWRKALAHHAINLAFLGSTFMLPVIVTSILSVTSSAYFYTSWMIANLVLTISAALTYTLYAVSSGQPDELTHKARMTLGLTVICGVMASGLLAVAGRSVLAVFGSEYATHGNGALQLLVLAVFPLTIRHHYVAIRRLEGRIFRTALVAAGAAALELTLAAVGAVRGGLTGLSLGWLIALCLEAIVMGGTVYRVVAPNGITRTIKEARRMWVGEPSG